MGRRTGFEAFQPYQRYLGQSTYWPSESSGEMVIIDGMVPRHAASALEKLIRWARLPSTYAHVNHSDVNGRETIVRNSLLGKALAQRAQGLSLTDPPPQDPEANLVLAIALVLSSAVRELSTYTVVDASRKIAKAIETEWTVTLKSR